MNERFEKYKLLVDGRDSVTISYLAAAVCLPEKTVQSEIQQMVTKGMFGKSAYINYMNKTLVLRQSADIGTQVSDLIRSVTDVTASAVRSATDAASSAMRSATGAVKQASDGMKNSTRTENTTPVRAKKKTESVTNNNKKMRIRKTNTAVMVLLLVFGVIMLGGGLFSALDLVDNLAAGRAFLNIDSLFEAANCVGRLTAGAVMLGLRSSFSKRDRRLTQYGATLSGRDSMNIAQLSAASGFPLKTVTKDLNYMMEKQMFIKGAHIDAISKTLYLSADAVPQEPAKKNEPAPEQEANEYYRIILEIRSLNDAIADVEVSERIDQIEEITAKIFRIVEEKPEKLSQIQSFMSYYLPTTLKLLNSYSTLEKQGIAGDNIDKAKTDIKRVLDQLVKGFSQQLDQLFKADVMDISTDIEVLERMMEKDGLTTDDSGFQKML